MQILKSIEDWQLLRRQMAPSLSLGLVPTMGNLHLGHQSLINTSLNNNDVTVVSIFVNPSQFDRDEDFKHYPKTLTEDLNLLQDMGVDYCIVPDTLSLYPEGFRYRISEHAKSLPLEGQKRPGHFSGVLTIVMMLFQIVKPHRSYFGEKDYQQYQLIKDMAQAFFLDIEVIACPTIRERSGLAFSSRNNRLSPSERVLAERFAALFHQQKSCAEIEIALNQLGIKVDYIDELDGRRFAAIFIGNIRLIDNYSLFRDDTTAELRIKGEQEAHPIV